VVLVTVALFAVVFLAVDGVVAFVAVAMGGVRAEVFALDAAGRVPALVVVFVRAASGARVLGAALAGGPDFAAAFVAAGLAVDAFAVAREGAAVFLAAVLDAAVFVVADLAVAFFAVALAVSVVLGDVPTDFVVTLVVAFDARVAAAPAALAAAAFFPAGAVLVADGAVFLAEVALVPAVAPLARVPPEAEARVAARRVPAPDAAALVPAAGFVAEAVFFAAITPSVARAVNADKFGRQ
jgi:hypothetical protein